MDLHARKGHAMTRVDVAGMRVGYYEPVDRHGLRPRDDKVGVGAWLLSLRGASGARDAAIHRVLGDAGGLSVRLLRTSGSPRPQGARDDKGG